MKMAARKKKILLLVAAFILIPAVLAGWIIWTNIRMTTTHYTITHEKIPEDFAGFQIAEVADLHNHDWGSQLIAALQKEAPDIIVITGDLVDSSHTDFDLAMEFVEQAVQTAPVYYVTGNHEAWLRSYPQLAQRLTAAGVHMMDDKAEKLKRGDSEINLAGVQDPDFVERETFDGLQESIVTGKLIPLLEPDSYNIVLCHRPELFEGYVQTGAELVLTGHAHGGQVRIPFVGGLVAPNQGLFPKYTEGVHHRDYTDMVVSRGLGNSILPVRINNMPELVIVTLNPAA